MAQPVDANAGIRGTIVDKATGEGLPSATIALYQDADSTFVTGTTTDTTGAFVLEGLPAGIYHLRFSYIGYQTVRQPDVEVMGLVELGRIALETSTEELEEAEVAAVRPLIEEKADRTVYNVADQPITAGTDALDVLRTLPSVRVDIEDNIELRGGKNVAIHVNDRPVPAQIATEYLRQLSSDDIERVEVIPNPSARYEAEGLSGIINIVLKEQTPDRGFSGTLSMTGSTNPYFRPESNLAWQRGNVDASVYYSYRLYSWDYSRSTETQYFDNASPVLSRLSLRELDQNLWAHVLGAQFQYTPTSQTTVSLDANYQYVGKPFDDSLAVASTFEGDITLEETLFMQTEGDGDEQYTQGAIDLQQTFNDDGSHQLQLRGEMWWDRISRDELGFQSGNELLQTERYDLIHEQRTTSLQADYTYPFSAGGRAETGVRASWERLTADVLFGAGGPDGRDTTSTDGFDYNRAVYAAYAQASVPLAEKLEAQGGLRLEHTERSFTLASSEEEASRSYTDLFPSVFLLYRFEPGTTVKASYSRRVFRPSTWILSPFANPFAFNRALDPTFQKRGNPHLRPAFQDSWELSFQYEYALTVTPFYQYTTDIAWRRFLQEGSVTVATMENFAMRRAIGVDLTVSGDIPGTPLSGYASGSLYQSDTEGGETEPDLSFSQTNWSIRANVQASLSPSTFVQTLGSFFGPRVSGDTRQLSSGSVSLGVKQQLMKDRLTVYLRLNDIFGTGRQSWEQVNHVFRESGTWNYPKQTFSLTLKWTFGELTRRQKRDPQQDGGAQVEIL